MKDKNPNTDTNPDPHWLYPFVFGMLAGMVVVLVRMFYE